jgi:hypothetical protein
MLLINPMWMHLPDGSSIAAAELGQGHLESARPW